MKRWFNEEVLDFFFRFQTDLQKLSRSRPASHEYE